MFKVSRLSLKKVIDCCPPSLFTNVKSTGVYLYSSTIIKVIVLVSITISMYLSVAGATMFRILTILSESVSIASLIS